MHPSADRQVARQTPFGMLPWPRYLIEANLLALFCDRLVLNTLETQFGTDLHVGGMYMLSPVEFQMIRDNAVC